MVPRLILLFGVVAAACAAGVITATSPAATQACALSSVGKLHGHVSMTFNESANGVIPGTPYTVTVSFARHATNVAVHLKKLKSKVPGYYFFVGGSNGGSFVVNDTYSGDGTGTMTASGKSLPITAGLGGHAGPCRYQLSVSFLIRTTSTGTAAAGYSGTVGTTFTTPQRTVPSSGKLAGSTIVPAAYDCDITYGTAGCAGFSDGWSTKFAMLKRCGATSAGTCQSEDDTDFGDATISWNLSPG
jgi:hypothetical protein